MEKIHILPTPFLKKASLLLIFMLQPVISLAVEVEIDGIKYDIVKRSKTATVITKSPIYTGDVVIPASVTYEDVECEVTSIGYKAFYNCSGLTSVTISSSVTSIGDYAFYGCFWLTSVNISSSVTSIGDYAFYNCSRLTSMTIPSSVTSIGRSAFYYCSGLTAVHISDLGAWCKIAFSGSSSNPLCYAHHLFLEDQEVKDMVIPSSVTSIGELAFFQCSGLNSVTIPSSVTSIGNHAFYGCSNLTSVTIPSSVTYIGGSVFSGCSGLTSVTIPSSVTYIGGSVFSGCSGLNSVTIPSSVTSIGDYAFRDCSGLTSVTIPSSVTSIGDYAFHNCSGLNSVTIPSSVTSIGKSAFTNCKGLTSVTIPSSVTSIGTYAFYGCTELADVYCYAETLPNMEIGVFDGSYPEYSTLHVPASAIESYRTTWPWNSFGTIVTLDGSEPVIPPTPPTLQCAAPAILYDNGRLEFACETEGAVCHYSVTDSDIQSGTGSSLTLSLTYHITAYATKEGYTSSEVSEATLCWIDYAPRQEGITTDMGNVKMETLANLQAKPVIITNHGGTLTISGAEDGTEVRVYDSSGVLCGSGISLNNQARITTDLPSGSIAIVQLGSRSVKVIVM